LLQIDSVSFVFTATILPEEVKFGAPQYVILFCSLYIPFMAILFLQKLIFIGTQSVFLLSDRHRNHKLNTQSTTQSLNLHLSYAETFLYILKPRFKTETKECLQTCDRTVRESAFNYGIVQPAKRIPPSPA